MPAKTVDEYISEFPADIQTRLEEFRKVIKDTAPGAEETISYAVPTYKLGGPLVHFGGYAKHSGFYPVPSAIEKFSDELAQYKRAKGSVQFPHAEPLPTALIKRMIEFRIKENSDLAKAKKK